MEWCIYMDKVHVSAMAALLMGVLYFFDDTGILSAVLPAVLIHEAGHMLTLWLFGAKLTRLHILVSGLKMDYSGNLSPLEEFISALAGPGFGLIYAWITSALGMKLGSEYLLCSSGVSFILSIFNLLPAAPIDGGICLGFVLSVFISKDQPELIEKIVFISGLFISLAMFAAGIFLAFEGLGLGLVSAAVWIFLLSCKDTCKNIELRIK